MTREEQRLAEHLCSRLDGDVSIEGKGVHWKVLLHADSGRRATANCFAYSARPPGVRMGMNAGNKRVASIPPTTAPYVGPEYLVRLLEGDQQVVSGRTRDEDSATAAMTAWTEGKTVHELQPLVPFIGAAQRQRERLAERLEPTLELERGRDPGHDLWIRRAEHSCRFSRGRCVFYLRSQALAWTTDDPLEAIHAWVRDGCTVAELATRSVALERHAEHIEQEPARWHWLHVKDRIADPNDVLSPLAPLIHKLADNPIVSRFYTFSSLNRLAFSASSHYPWVSGFPHVAPVRDGDAQSWSRTVVVFDGETLALDEAVARIEEALKASPVEPFFGTEDDLALIWVAEELRRQGSTLVPEQIREQQWVRVVLRFGGGFGPSSGTQAIPPRRRPLALPSRPLATWERLTESAQSQAVDA
jgi:hypothetical protein